MQGRGLWRYALSASWSHPQPRFAALNILIPAAGTGLVPEIDIMAHQGYPSRFVVLSSIALLQVTLTSIVSLLHQDTIKTRADTVGFVFPNFCLTIPIPVHDFLVKADLASAQYLFALCTRGGSQTEAFAYMNQLLKKQGKKLSAQLDINMPWNHPVGPENLVGLNSEERTRQLESAMQSQLDDFSQAVATRSAYVPADTGADHELSWGMKVFDLLVPKALNYSLHDYIYQELVRFYSDETCSGCGICEKVCLSGRIEVAGKKPRWNKAVRCYACFACINYCPRRAIQVESRFPIQSATTVNGRYHHESITYNEIARQRGHAAEWEGQGSPPGQGVDSASEVQP